MFHCLLTFRQFLPLVLSVLTILVIRSKETFAGGTSAFNAGGGGGTGSRGGSTWGGGGGGSLLSSSAFSSSSSSSSGYSGGGGSSDLYSSYGGSSFNDNNNTEKPERNPTVYQIGGVLSNNKSIACFNETIQVNQKEFLQETEFNTFIYTIEYQKFQKNR